MSTSTSSQPPCGDQNAPATKCGQRTVLSCDQCMRGQCTACTQRDAFPVSSAQTQNVMGDPRSQTTEPFLSLTFKPLLFERKPRFLECVCERIDTFLFASCVSSSVFVPVCLVWGNEVCLQDEEWTMAELLPWQRQVAQFSSLWSSGPLLMNLPSKTHGVVSRHSVLKK